MGIEKIARCFKGHAALGGGEDDPVRQFVHQHCQGAANALVGCRQMPDAEGAGCSQFVHVFTPSAHSLGRRAALA